MLLLLPICEAQLNNWLAAKPFIKNVWKKSCIFYSYFWIKILWRVFCPASQSRFKVSQSEQMSAGIMDSVRAHVSITANLIICQCAGLKSIPVSFHLNINWECHTSESRPAWYHVSIWVAGVHITNHVPQFTWISVTDADVSEMSESEAIIQWLWCVFYSYRNKGTTSVLFPFSTNCFWRVHVKLQKTLLTLLFFSRQIIYVIHKWLTMPCKMHNAAQICMNPHS